MIVMSVKIRTRTTSRTTSLKDRNLGGMKNWAGIPRNAQFTGLFAMWQGRLGLAARAGRPCHILLTD